MAGSATPLRLVRRWPATHDHHAIELLAAGSVLLALIAMGLPASLVFAHRPDRDHPVDRLLEACQEGVARGSFAVVGLICALLVVFWASLFLARLSWRAAHDLTAMRRLRRQLVLAPFTSVVVGGRPYVIALLADHSAFTTGLLRPRVCLGRKFIDALDPDETEAVVLHEMEHRRLRDPLRCWLVDIILGSVGWRPARGLSLHYRASREASADAATVRRQGDDRPLLRALAKASNASTLTGACGLTSDRAAALRQLRYAQLDSPRAAWLGTVLGFSLVLSTLVVAAMGLTDWQPYWFCPSSSTSAPAL